MMEFISRNYAYMIVLIMILVIIYLRFFQKKLPVFKDFYNMQIVEFTLFFGVVISVVLTNSDISFLAKNISNLSEMASISGILAGFIFAGVSILYSFMGNKTISEHFKYSFMDNVFSKLFLSIATSVLVIIFYVVILIFPELFIIDIIKLFISLFLMSLIYFMWSIFELYKFLRKLKKIL